MVSNIVQFAMDWVEGAWSSGSSIERAALCCVLANFQMIPTLFSGTLNISTLVSPKYRLLYGHHLSRTGHLRQAEEWLASALMCYPGSQINTRLQGYQFELVSVLIRLGRWQHAETRLTSIEYDAKFQDPYRRDSHFEYVWVKLQRRGSC